MEQQVNNGRRNRRTRQQIEELLAEFDKVNVMVKQFCEQHTISQGVFHKWKSRRKETGLEKTTASGFAKVLIGSSSPDVLFAEVNGIRFYQVVSAAYLKELIA